MIRRIIVSFGIVLCGGCAGLKPVLNGSEDLIQPKVVHVSDLTLEGNRPTGELPAGVIRNVAAENYLATFRLALDVARSNAEAPMIVGDPNLSRAYLDAGQQLVNVYCSRWFDEIEKREIRLEHAQENYNVLTELGTSLLGIGGAASNFVTLYGAGTGAFTAISNNYGSTFLLAPSPTTVREKVFDALADRALQDRKAVNGAGETGVSFNRLYMMVERYASLCSLATARRIVNESLEEAEVTANENGVRIEVIDQDARDEIENLKFQKGFVETQLSEARDESGTLKSSVAQLKDQLETALDSARNEANEQNLLISELRQVQQNLVGQLSERDTQILELQQQIRDYEVAVDEFLESGAE